MRQESSNKIKCNIKNSAHLQHTKTIATHQANHWIFNRHIFDSCDIETISQVFFFTPLLLRCNIYKESHVDTGNIKERQHQIKASKTVTPGSAKTVQKVVQVQVTN
jgi:hypothetical protein